MGRYLTELILFFIDFEIVLSKKTQETDIPKNKKQSEISLHTGNWINFLACPKNKADYANFLSKQMKLKESFD